jgi:hypothetical protein
LSTTPSSPFAASPSLSSPENRTPLRAKTLGTRLTPEELSEVEAAAKQSGKNVAEWLREVALRAARPSPDVNELLLGEIAAMRYALLNLFHATAQAGEEGRSLSPESVLKIRETADARKREQARKLLQDFLAEEGQGGSRKGAGR